jgi:hypothetical protein
LVKARVSRLDAIPFFFNFTEGSDPESNCWTAQCEILLTRLLGAQAHDEDFPPEDPDDIDPNNFDFFGFGQPGQRPPNPPDGPPDNFNANPANPIGWAPWPQNGLTQNQQILQVVRGANIPDIAAQQIFDQQEEAPPLIPLQLEPAEEVVINPQGPVNLLHQEVMQIQQELVLATDEMTDTNSEAENQPAALPIPLQPFLVDEMPLEDMVPFDDLAPQAPDAVDMGNIQLGFVQTFVPPVDPMQLSAPKLFQRPMC